MRRRLPGPTQLALFGVVLAAVIHMHVDAAAAVPVTDSAPPGDAAVEPATAVERTASACPRADAVWSELRSVISGERTSARGGAPARPEAAPAIALVDLGGAFRVIVNGREREYRDEGRDCARRARVAAVFAAVALGPPAVETPPAPTPAAAAATVVARAAPPLAPATELEVGVTIESGVASQDRATLVGPALRVAVGRGTWRFVAGVAGLAPADTTVGTVTVRQAHVPVDAGIRAGLRAGGFDLSTDLGLCAGALWTRAVDLGTPRSATTFEWGARAGVTLRYQAFAHLAPFVAVGGQLVASPAALYALPRGVIGHAPPLWIGARAGAAVAF